MKTKKLYSNDEIFDQLREFELEPTEMLTIRGGDGSGPETDPDPPVVIIPEDG